MITIPFPAATIRDAMRAINESGTGLVVAVDASNHAVGVVSDGDIRRALLNGRTLEEPVDAILVRNYRRVGVGASRAEVLDLMQALRISQIPIVDGEGLLCGLHTLQGILGRRDRPNWAVVMCGGMGTRLHPLTEHLPKSMLPVAGRPILERILLHLLGHGIDKVFLATNHLSSRIEAHFGDGSGLGCTIRYLREDRPLGSGGALSLLPPAEHPVLVMNGDLVTEADLSGILDAHERSGCYATMATRAYQHEVPFGCVTKDASGRLTGLEEKPILERCINAGIYVLSPRAVRAVPAGTFFPMTALFEAALAQGEPCGAFALDGEWIDVGRPEQLAQAQGRL